MLHDSHAQKLQKRCCELAKKRDAYEVKQMTPALPKPSSLGEESESIL
jgi:hypothetical protein